MMVGNVVGLLTDVFLGKTVEIANHFRGKVFGFFWGLDDWDLEMAPLDLFLSGLVGKENDGFADQINFCALFSIELYLELPIAQANVLVCIKQCLHALSV